MKTFNRQKANIYDSIVIGTGPSAEPVLNHLSKSNHKVCLIDSGNIFKKIINRINSKNPNLSKISPKKILDGFKFVYNSSKFLKKYKTTINSKNFTYIYTKKTGGLSNFWGGGAYIWPDEDLIKTTSIPINMIKKSYKEIINRIPIVKISDVTKLSPLAKYLLNKFPFLKESFLFINKENIFRKKFEDSIFNQNLIWNSTISIRNYVRSKNIFYFKNHIVFDIKKNNQIWVIKCFFGKKIKTYYAKNIFCCAGTINSTNLAFKALNHKKIKIKLKHNYISIIPFFSYSLLRDKGEKLLETPELSFSYFDDDIKRLISGTLLSSQFLIKKLNKFYIIRKFTFLKNILNFILNHFGFVIILAPSDFSNSHIELILKNGNTNIKIINIDSRRKIKLIFKKIKNNFKLNFSNKLLFFYLFQKISRTGSDIHYAGTMPEKNLCDSDINTDNLGQVIGLEGFYICDPSRLSFLSSLPHTLTSMAIVDASMPLILQKC